MIHPPSYVGPIRPSEGVFARLFDDELFVVDLTRGEYFGLDDIGARLWRGLVEGRTLEQVAQDVTCDYEVEFEKAVEDLGALAAELIARGLLVDAASITFHAR